MVCGLDKRRNSRLERARNCQSGDNREISTLVVRFWTTWRHVRHCVGGIVFAAVRRLQIGKVRRIGSGWLERDRDWSGRPHLRQRALDPANTSRRNGRKPSGRLSVSERNGSLCGWTHTGLRRKLGKTADII